MGAPLLFLEDLSTSEMFIILMLALLLFGGKLPEVARGFGRAMTRLKAGFKEYAPDVQEARAQVTHITNDLRDAARDLHQQVDSSVGSEFRAARADVESIQQQLRDATAPEATVAAAAAATESPAPFPGTLPEPHDPWLSTEVAPGCTPLASDPPAVSKGPTGASGIVRTSLPVSPRGPVTPSSP